MQKRRGFLMFAAVLAGAVLSFSGGGLVAAADKVPTHSKGRSSKRASGDHQNEVRRH